jgi:hypothetical protein
MTCAILLVLKRVMVHDTAIIIWRTYVLCTVAMGVMMMMTLMVLVKRDGVGSDRGGIHFCQIIIGHDCDGHRVFASILSNN